MSNLQIHWAPSVVGRVPSEFHDPEFFATILWEILEDGSHRVTSPLRPGRTYHFGAHTVDLVISQPAVEGMEQVPLVEPVVEVPEPPRKRFRSR